MQGIVVLMDQDDEDDRVHCCVPSEQGCGAPYAYLRHQQKLRDRQSLVRQNRQLSDALTMWRQSTVTSGEDLALLVETLQVHQLVDTNNAPRFLSYILYRAYHSLRFTLFTLVRNGMRSNLPLKLRYQLRVVYEAMRLQTPDRLDDLVL